MPLVDAEHQRIFRTELRQWLTRHVTQSPTHRWQPDELLTWSRELHDAGYVGLTWPNAHGGRGLPPSYQAIYAEESARVGAPDHINIIGLNMVGPTIIRFGTAAQQEHYLPRILSAHTIFCQGFSEPEAGSDLAAIRTAAQPHHDGWRINGEKVWSSYAHLADHCLLLARTGPPNTRHGGLTCFLVNLRTPGVTVSPLRKLSGEPDFNRIHFDDVCVAPEQVLGGIGEGWTVAMTTLAHERGTFGLTLTSRLAAQVDRLRQTLQDAGLSHDPNLRRDLAALYVEMRALRATGYRALSSIEQTGSPGPESSILKLRWSLANQHAAAIGMRVAGRLPHEHHGAQWRNYWQQQRLSSRTNTIEGGTTEILRGIIAERVLGLPRAR
ncbi:acyl-CoA dehydrogenase family protein [Micromonospora sediminicola]|uniref:acyl-CoA dehydrogenase family protein n=1 Tax=Micromonospora sediminicola TaxID=946078 RepID=UPI0033DA67B3